MAKRLTLTEYRQENAIWLANHVVKDNSVKTESEYYNFIIQNYIIYLLMYGVLKQGEKIKYKGQYIMESDIEAYLESKQTNITEHCPH
jgi:hypothetical protein